MQGVQLIKNDEDAEIGHSLGGALATLLALELSSSHGQGRAPWEFKHKEKTVQRRATKNQDENFRKMKGVWASSTTFEAMVLSFRCLPFANCSSPIMTHTSNSLFSILSLVIQALVLQVLDVSDICAIQLLVFTSQRSTL